MSDGYPVRLESFEVVLVKPGKNQMTADPEDFERVPVDAGDPLAAIMSEAVQAKVKAGYTSLFAARPGVLTDPEILARSRAASGPPVDRSKL